MMTVLLIIHSVTTDSVISAVNAITVKMELTGPVVRAEMDTPLKRAEIVRVQVQLNQLQALDQRKAQVMCSIDVVSFCSKNLLET